MSETKIKPQYLDKLDRRYSKEVDYNFKLPKFGESNTDQSYYEPQSSRIANMYKSASGLSTGAYDFDEDHKIDLDKDHVPFGRKQGLTFEEVSQVQTRNAASIKSQANNAEKDMAAQKAAKQDAINQAVEMSKAIDNRDE